MILDSGAVTIYAVRSDEGAAVDPSVTLTPRLTAPFGERVVGATRYYAAAKAGQQIDRTVRIWAAPDITVRDVAKIGTGWYLIRKVTQLTDEDGLRVTDLDLEDTDGSAWEGSYVGQN